MKIKQKFALRTRLWCVLFFNAFAVLALVGCVAYSYINVINRNKIQNEMQISANNLRYELNYVFNDFSSMQTQLSVDSDLLSDIETVYAFRRWGDRHDGAAVVEHSSALSRIINKILYMKQANSRIGGVYIYYYDENGEVSIINTGDGTKIEFGKLLTQTQKIRYAENDNLYIYIEARSGFLQEVLENNRSSTQTFFVLTDEQGQVIYSENEELFALGTAAVTVDSKENDIERDGYYLFSDLRGTYGIIQGIAKTEYYSHLVVWSQHFISVCFVTLVLTALLAMFIWRIIYGPFRVLQEEFRSMVQSKSEPAVRTTNIREFDELLEEFYHARESIRLMSREIEERERKQKELEIEKLLIQINPHFIYNTLNCIQWMARLKGDQEICRMLSLFMRIIEYNLGKGDIFVTFQEEIEVIENYVELQQIKNGQDLRMKLEIQEELKTALIPRFILQPIVENIILHGGKGADGLQILITAQECQENSFYLKIQDNGIGMTKEQIEEVLYTVRVSKKKDRGIGLSYVNDMVQFYCGQESRINIESQRGNGTIVSMKLPVRYEREREDERIDR